MITKRLELSLDLLKPSEWEKFEKLASIFLASEFDELRTVAAQSGDGGRDSELYSPLSEPKVVCQYSVAEDWQAKINATVRRLKTTIPDVLVLVYATNKQIGADADELKKRLRTKHGLTLDIRDKNWFCDRVLETQSRQIAAEEMACLVVDPYLSSSGIGSKTSTELSSPEAIAALTFLGLQWQDDARDKGLTKLAFGALVRAALVDTDTNNRITKAELYDRVSRVLPGHPIEQLKQPIDTAIRHLGKSAIKQWPGEEFCLSHDELIKFKEFKAEKALAEKELTISIEQITNLLLSKSSESAKHAQDVTHILRSITDAVLLERSQSFAMAVQSGALANLAENDFKSTILSELTKSNLPKIPNVDWINILQRGVGAILTSDAPAIQQHLRSLADSYTLMAFLKQTPDVQSAVEKMFSHGKIWLDTTVILPLIAESLSSGDEGSGRFSRMIQAALDAGLKLHVTPGVIEEIERHMNRSLVCARMDLPQWNGAIPYLLEKYVGSGRSILTFSSWLENFRGSARPLQDLSDYLREELKIHERSLERESDSASQELKRALHGIWLERYERRKERYGVILDDMAVTRLISHDIECYTGVVQLRIQEKSSPFGYSAWWLTVDRQTFDLKSRLRTLMAESPPDSPVMSADFLVNYLAFGPLRRRVTKNTESHLPLLMILGNAGQLTPELMVEAEALRSQLQGLPERIVRRQVRDHLDRARAATGPISNQGMDSLEETLSLDVKIES
ncbi:TPA: hypothetical protein ACXN4Q_002529 [Pseudomonas aeruginosa]|nr:hypothetical protein [Pseudomonas aeruginosa]MDV6934494.1 hypothetical protein [Pseudomonas aeruginosa]MDV6957132.1 hypothetical protein [Pseudomonas aeruginosa]